MQARIQGEREQQQPGKVLLLDVFVGAASLEGFCLECVGGCRPAGLLKQDPRASCPPCHGPTATAAAAVAEGDGKTQTLSK